MAQPQNHPLRPLNVQEERELHRIVKASSERIDVARRARALLAVAAKQSFPQAASVAGFKEARSVSDLVVDDAAASVAPDGSARDRRRNDTPSAARSWLQLPAHTYLGTHRLRAAGAQKRHGDDV